MGQVCSGTKEEPLKDSGMDVTELTTAEDIDEAANTAAVVYRRPKSLNAVTYDGLVLTTIQLYGFPDGKTSVDELVDGDRVMFNEMDGNEGATACFVKDVVQDVTEGVAEESYRVFSATYVSPSTAATMADAGHGNGTCMPLFYVHGFNMEPSYTLGTTMPMALQRCEEDNVYFPVPVVWPVYGSLLGYKNDQSRYSLEAGQNLQRLVDSIPNDVFPKKSLVCHSMGNHLVLNGACGTALAEDPDGPPGPAPDVVFENIFMVAADVPGDCFAADPSDPHGTKKADNLKAMLAEGGKIHVLHNEGDLALKGSFYVNSFRERLGRLGPESVRPDFADLVVVHDAKPLSDADEEKDDWKLHGYEWEDYAIDIYNRAATGSGSAGGTTPEPDNGGGCVLS